jgi:hypothetical protein
VGDLRVRHQLRAELRKLISPLLLVVIVVFGLGVWRDLGSTSQHFASQSKVSSGVVLAMQKDLEEVCSGATADARGCELARRDQVANERFIENSRWMGRVGAALGTPAGVVKFVARQLTAGYGWLMIAALAMVSVVGERSSGTSREAVRLLGRRRFVLLKGSVVAFAAIGMGVAVVGSLLMSRSNWFHPVTAYTGMDGDGFTGSAAVAADPAWTSFGSVAAAVCQAVIVVVLVAFVAAASAALSRSIQWFGLLALAATAAVFGISRFAPGFRGGPMAIIDDAFRMADVPPGMNDVRLWDVSRRAGELDQAVHLHAGSWALVVSLTFGVVAVVAVLMGRFERADIAD